MSVAWCLDLCLFTFANIWITDIAFESFVLFVFSKHMEESFLV